MAETALGGILLLIVAGLLPWMLPAAPALAWLIWQNVLLVLCDQRYSGYFFQRCALAGGCSWAFHCLLS